MGLDYYNFRVTEKFWFPVTVSGKIGSLRTQTMSLTEIPRVHLEFFWEWVLPPLEPSFREQISEPLVVSPARLTLSPVKTAGTRHTSIKTPPGSDREAYSQDRIHSLLPNDLNITRWSIDVRVLAEILEISQQPRYHQWFLDSCHIGPLCQGPV